MRTMSLAACECTVQARHRQAPFARLSNSVDLPSGPHSDSLHSLPQSSVLFWQLVLWKTKHPTLSVLQKLLKRTGDTRRS